MGLNPALEELTVNRSICFKMIAPEERPVNYDFIYTYSL